MSIFKDIVKCKYCGYEVKWKWQIPDCRVDYYSDNPAYHFVQCHKKYNKYHIVKECPNCKNYISEYYDSNGNRVIVNNLDDLMK